MLHGIPQQGIRGCTTGCIGMNAGEIPIHELPLHWWYPFFIAGQQHLTSSHHAGTEYEYGVENVDDVSYRYVDRKEVVPSIGQSRFLLSRNGFTPLE